MKKSGSQQSKSRQSKSPSQLIDARIKELGDWRGKMLSRIRHLIKQADPDVIEEVKWKKPSNPTGVPVWAHDGIICTGETYKGKVKITFAEGASIEDPAGLFNAGLEGNARRAIDIHEGDKIEERAFKALVRAAAALNASSARLTMAPRHRHRSPASSRTMSLHVGIYDHLGWAVAVTASGHHDVVDRRRIDLLEPGVPNMPIHRPGEGRSREEIEALVAQVRASAERATAASLDALTAALPGPVASVHLRALPADFPTDIAIQLRPPYEARADAIMYRQLLAAVARARGWAVEFYDAKTAEADAATILGGCVDEVLRGPRDRLGPPWAKDHRTALAATIVAVSE